MPIRYLKYKPEDTLDEFVWFREKGYNGRVQYFSGNTWTDSVFNNIEYARYKLGNGCSKFMYEEEFNKYQLVNKLCR